MTDTAALPEQYRPVSSIRRGYEIRMADGAWLAVTDVEPAEEITFFDFADGSQSLQHTGDEVMSRRPTTAGSDPR